jgi:NAD(P)-dependent dehydrogenase (short-subunit alcohol dehydrogenase family)
LSFDPRNYEYRPGLLKNRNILITGASDGIGEALALCTAKLGATVILHGRNIKKLESVYDAIQALDGVARPSIALMDLATADSDAYLSLADSIAKEFGQLDGLVHNAAILGEKISIEQYETIEWQRVMHVNVTAAFRYACKRDGRVRADTGLSATSPGSARSVDHFHEQRCWPQGPRLLGRLCSFEVCHRRFVSGSGG